MKKNVKLIRGLLILTLISGVKKNNAAVGCLDNSFYVERDYYYDSLDPSVTQDMHVWRNQDDYPLDEKVWQPTECTCPCENYRKDLKADMGAMGFCQICRHRGDLDRKSAQNIEPDHHDIKKEFALLGTIIKHGNS
jgi:hypothetical protein